jgi:hypothetical protein
MGRLVAAIQTTQDNKKDGGAGLGLGGERGQTPSQHACHVQLTIPSTTRMRIKLKLLDTIFSRTLSVTLSEKRTE